jgi:hypothetical protein
MLKPTTAHPFAFNFSLAATLVSGCLISAFLLLSFGYSSSAQGLAPDPGQPRGGPPTTAEHDIAPWDGQAFGLWIPSTQFGGKPNSWIYARIWDKPENSQRKFNFPDKSMRVGTVTYLLDLKSPRLVDWIRQPRQELKGWLRLIRANGRQPVIGEFDFVSEEAVVLKGRFEAQWINKDFLNKGVHRDAADS